MSNSGFAPPVGAAIGYDPPPFTDRPLPAAQQPQGAMAPAGGLGTTAPDLARWLVAQLAGRGTLLAPRSLDELHANPGGLGWLPHEIGGRAGSWHGGGVLGFQGSIFIDRSADRGVVVLTNMLGHAAIDKVAGTIDRSEEL